LATNSSSNIMSIASKNQKMKITGQYRWRITIGTETTKDEVKTRSITQRQVQAVGKSISRPQGYLGEI
jgi:hypothetical protein